MDDFDFILGLSVIHSLEISKDLAIIKQHIAML